jgi:uncharacterized membrane protein YphA (DoxX/SURF4 family)
MIENPRERLRRKIFIVAGLVAIAILGVIYLNLDAIRRVNIDLSEEAPRPNISHPWLSNINLDWFYAMDPPTQLIFGFLMLALIGSLIGGLGMILVRKRAAARK